MEVNLGSLPMSLGLGVDCSFADLRELHAVFDRHIW